MSAGTTTPPSVRRPILNFKRSLNASSDDGSAVSTGETFYYIFKPTQYITNFFTTFYSIFITGREELIL